MYTGQQSGLVRQAAQQAVAAVQAGDLVATERAVELIEAEPIEVGLGFYWALVEHLVCHAVVPIDLIWSPKMRLRMSPAEMWAAQFIQYVLDGEHRLAAASMLTPTTAQEVGERQWALLAIVAGWTNPDLARS